MLLTVFPAIVFCAAITILLILGVDLHTDEGTGIV